MAQSNFRSTTLTWVTCRSKISRQGSNVLQHRTQHNHMLDYCSCVSFDYGSFLPGLANKVLQALRRVLSSLGLRISKTIITLFTSAFHRSSLPTWSGLESSARHQISKIHQAWSACPENGRRNILKSAKQTVQSSGRAIMVPNISVPTPKMTTVPCFHNHPPPPIHIRFQLIRSKVLMDQDSHRSWRILQDFPTTFPCRRHLPLPPGRASVTIVNTHLLCLVTITKAGALSHQGKTGGLSAQSVGTSNVHDLHL